MARFPVPEETVTFAGGWRAHMRAVTQERIWEVTQSQVGDPLFELRVSQAVAVASIVTLTDPNGVEVPASMEWFKRLPNGLAAKLVAVADTLNTADLDMGFSEPQSPETSDSAGI